MLLATPDMNVGMGAFFAALAGVWVALGIAIGRALRTPSVVVFGH
jgi:hypothetical protein